MRTLLVNWKYTACSNGTVIFGSILSSKCMGVRTRVFRNAGDYKGDIWIFFQHGEWGYDPL